MTTQTPTPDPQPDRASAKNTNLHSAKSAKNDEFYTQWADIEREMVAYVDYNPDVFRDKTVLLPCDDPEWSNFTKFFALRFSEYGIKRLVSTSYAPDSKPESIDYQPTLFEIDDPKFDAAKTRTRGKKFVLDRTDMNNDGVINYDDLKWEYLDGDGDFRSAEVTALRDEADIVITNPPFSLFREFIAWLNESTVSFSIIGNMNAITYKEVFPLIKTNELWLGTGQPKEFRDGTPNAPAPTKTFGNIKWFTNIEHGRRHQPLQLMTAADNERFSKHKEIKNVGYQTYDNYNAIEVPYVDAIPSDRDGVMGVPISFLDKYNPDQFELIGATESEGKGFSNGLWHQESQIAQATVNGNRVYKRLFIRHRKGKSQ